MPNPMPAAPAGWYPDAEGVQRYWDGRQWLDIPAPMPGIASATVAKRPWSKRVLPWLAVGVAVVAIVGGSVAGLTAAVQARTEAVEAAAAQAQLEEQQAEEAASAERAAEEAAFEQEQQESRERHEREMRAAMIPDVEDAIAEMASGHIADGVLDGEVLDVHCTPVDGYAVADLAQPSAVMDCFVSTEDNGNGTFGGYHYHATVNWQTLQFSYGLGTP